LEIYAKLEKQTPDNEQLLLLTGATQLQAGDKAQARQKFEQVLVKTPDNLLALEQVVNMDIEEKKYGAAEQFIQAKLSQAPTNAVLNMLMAKVQLAAGN